MVSRSHFVHFLVSATPYDIETDQVSHDLFGRKNMELTIVIHHINPHRLTINAGTLEEACYSETILI